MNDKRDFPISNNIRERTFVVSIKWLVISSGFKARFCVILHFPCAAFDVEDGQASKIRVSAYNYVY